MLMLLLFIVSVVVVEYASNLIPKDFAEGKGVYLFLLGIVVLIVMAILR